MRLLSFALVAMGFVATAQARPWGPPPNRVFIATFETDLGDIRCILRHEQAPDTVRNFVELAQGKRGWTDPATGQPTRRPLYTGTVFHRVIPEFMIQGGDPLGDGSGGPGYTFADEGGDKNRFERSGLLAMANRGPDTNGSQFFITDAPAPHLNGKHTVFGDCGNPEVVKRIANAPRDEGDRPTPPIVLDRVVISVQ
ncbi:MAG: peptidylprolyl isomerase [Pseudomonadota bacterium]|nr:peptidylprolyl isomerase [Pseudomonadota bacterium]